MGKNENKASYTGHQEERLYTLFNDVKKEMTRAKKLFPDPSGSMVALMEEVGELAKALLDEGIDRIRAEAVQVAGLALRIVLEGDPTLTEVRKKRGSDGK